MALKESERYEKCKPLLDELSKDKNFSTILASNTSSTKAYVDSSKKQLELSCIIPQNNEDFKKLIDLRTRINKTPVELTDKGVVVTERMSDILGVGIGDKFTMLISDEPYEVTITGITENYASNYIYMMPSYYEQLTGNNIRYNTIYAQINNTNSELESSLATKWMKNDNIITISFVSGKGAEILRKAGIEVIEDFMRDECDKLNPIFFRYITTKLPYVSLKYAMTADGKIATYSGKSKWITNEFSRNDVHRLRKKHRAIMVGIGTVLADNPMLNCRIENGRNPIRIVCDSKLRIPLDCNICKTANEISTLVVSAIENSEKQSELEKMGVKTLILPDKNGKVDLKKLMQYLGEKSIDSVLIEGGGTLAYSALQAKIVNHIYSYIAPKIFGGENAKTPVESVGVEAPDDCFKLKRTNVRELGSDILIEYDVLEVQ